MLLVSSLSQLSSFLQKRKAQGSDFTLMTGVGNPFYIAISLHDFLVNMEKDDAAVALVFKLRNLVVPSEKGESVSDQYLRCGYSRGTLIDNSDYAYEDVDNLISECSALLNSVSPEGMYFGGNEGCSTDLGWFFKPETTDSDNEAVIRVEADFGFDTETVTGDGSPVLGSKCVLGTVTGRITSDKANYEPVE